MIVVLSKASRTKSELRQTIFSENQKCGLRWRVPSPRRRHQAPAPNPLSTTAPTAPMLPGRARRDQPGPGRQHRDRLIARPQNGPEFELYAGEAIEAALVHKIGDSSSMACQGGAPREVREPMMAAWAGFCIRQTITDDVVSPSTEISACLRSPYVRAVTGGPIRSTHITMIAAERGVGSPRSA